MEIECGISGDIAKLPDSAKIFENGSEKITDNENFENKDEKSSNSAKKFRKRRRPKASKPRFGSNFGSSLDF